MTGRASGGEVNHRDGAGPSFVIQVMIGQEDGPQREGVELSESDQGESSTEDNRSGDDKDEERGSDQSEANGTSGAGTQREEYAITTIGDVLSNPIADVGLILLLVFVWFFGVRHRPKYLDESGRPIGASMVASLPVLAWYFIFLPVVLGFAILAVYGKQSAEFFQDPHRTAHLSWIGHALTLPVLLMWWMGRRVNRAYQPTDRPSMWTCPNLAGDPILERMRHASPRSWGYSIVFALIAFFVAYPVIVFVNGFSAWCKYLFTGATAPQIAHQTLTTLEHSTSHWLTAMIVVSVTVAAPVFEEFIFRGSLQTLLRSFTRSSWIAIIITSAVFASRHIGVATPESLPGLFALAVAMGAGYAWTGRIITPIVIHVLFNAGNVGLLFLLAGGASGS